MNKKDKVNKTKKELIRHAFSKAIFILFGMLISSLYMFFGLKGSFLFLIGFLFGVQGFRTVIIVRQKGQGNLAILTFKHLLFVILQSLLAGIGFLIGLGILRVLI